MGILEIAHSQGGHKSRDSWWHVTKIFIFDTGCSCAYLLCVFVEILQKVVHRGVEETFFTEGEVISIQTVGSSGMLQDLRQAGLLKGYSCRRISQATVYNWAGGVLKTVGLLVQCSEWQLSSAKLS